MPTPATADASRWDAGFTVDLDEAARAADAMVGDGVDGIITAGTFGEGATLTRPEWEAFARAVHEAIAGRVPLVVGAQTLNTRTTISRMRFLRDLGVQGTMLGRPMWCELAPEGIVDYYRSAAEAVPELGIITYDNAFAFKGRLMPDTYRQLAGIPQVVAAKYTSVDGLYRQVMAAVRGRIRLMPIELDWYPASQWYPQDAAACWSSSASCDPYPSVRLRDLIASGRLRDAEALTRRLAWTYETLYPGGGDWHLFSIYNIPLEKIRIDAAGYMKAGPVRPPYHHIPEAYAEGARENGRRWRALATELRAAAAGSA
jgi:dihydrodipicolinate synthase/N-acetylneuraminate lyase